MTPEKVDGAPQPQRPVRTPDNKPCSRRQQDTPAVIGNVAAPGVRILWRRSLAASRQESEARRQRVLRYPDLAEQLRQPPLRLSDAGRWSGWIPPARQPEDACSACNGGTSRPACRGREHYARRNSSPIREQLVGISREALARESGG